MAALLVGMSVMAVLMSAAMPVWSHFAKREKEEELLWRGQQYARAVGLFQRKYANTFPPTLDVLVEQRFLRKKFKDPITNDDFQLIPAGGGPAAPGFLPPGGPLQQLPGTTGAGQPPAQLPPGGRPAAPTLSGVPGGSSAGSIGLQGVVSKSTATSIKIYNGRTKYNEWAFVYLATSQRVGPGPGINLNGPGTQGQQRPSGRPPVPPGFGGPGGPGPSGPGGPGGPFGPGGSPSPFGPRPPGGRPPG
ncbi:MAG TPA: hypothetical protein VNJ02_12335 [Vicinamibacterales bacterium]|nr:hypothetical protein [Vicinamibacterales bacterium]